MRHNIFFILITVFLVGLLLWALPSVEVTKWDIASVVQLSLIGLMLSGSVLFLYQQKPAKALKHGLIWLTIAFVCVALYAGKNNIVASLVPGYASQNGTDVLAIRAAADGHFYLNLIVNGKPMRFMVDTGASSITLPINAAKKLGILTENLAFTQAFETANGQVFAAPITLDTLEIGGHQFTQVPAFVNQAELNTPLLGIRFLNHTKSIEIRDDELIIRF